MTSRRTALRAHCPRSMPQTPGRLGRAALAALAEGLVVTFSLSAAFSPFFLAGACAVGFWAVLVSAGWMPGSSAAIAVESALGEPGLVKRGPGKTQPAVKDRV